MAEESMLDKALALVPGLSGAKPKRKKAQAGGTGGHLAKLRQGMARLAKDFERLVGLVEKQSKPARAPRKVAAKRTATRQRSGRTSTAARKRAATKT